MKLSELAKAVAVVNAAAAVPVAKIVRCGICNRPYVINCRHHRSRTGLLVCPNKQCRSEASRRVCIPCKVAKRPTLTCPECGDDFVQLKRTQVCCGKAVCYRRYHWKRNRDRLKAACRAWHHANPDKVKEYDRARRVKHGTKIRQKAAEVRRATHRQEAIQATSSLIQAVEEVNGIV